MNIIKLNIKVPSNAVTLRPDNINKYISYYFVLICSIFHDTMSLYFKHKYMGIWGVCCGILLVYFYRGGLTFLAAIPGIHRGPGISKFKNILRTKILNYYLSIIIDLNEPLSFGVDKKISKDLKVPACGRSPHFDKNLVVAEGRTAPSFAANKDYTNLAIRNFIKGLLSIPPKYNLVNDFKSYSEIIDFIKNYKRKIRISKSSLSNLKNRRMVIKAVPRTKETERFTEYVKTRYKNFDDKTFFATRSSESRLGVNYNNNNNYKTSPTGKFDTTFDVGGAPAEKLVAAIKIKDLDDTAHSTNPSI